MPALYAVVGRLTAGVTFLGVGFLPAVAIPAIFAVLYGPWVGGIGERSAFSLETCWSMEFHF